MDKENISPNNHLLVRNYSLENVPANSPGKMFINPTEIFVFNINGDGSRSFSLWTYFDGSLKTEGGILDRPHVKVTTFLLPPDMIAAPSAILDALKTGVSHISLEQRNLSPGKQRSGKIICRFLSYDELLGVISQVVNASLEARELIAADATAVPVNSDTKVVDVAELFVDAHEAISSSAEFEVTGTAPAQAPAERKPTLQEIEDEDEPEYVTRPIAKKRRTPNYWILALLAVVALTIGWAVVSFLPAFLPESSYSKGEEMVVDEQYTALQDFSEPCDTPVNIPVNDPVNDPVEITEETPVEIDPETTVNADESDDLDYLNTHDIWDINQLKSEKYRLFFPLLSSGNILEIAESDYFAVPDNLKNPTARKIIDLLWASYKTGTQTANERQLHRLKGQQKIDLPKLYDTLARYRDKSPNKSPRPQR